MWKCHSKYLKLKYKYEMSKIEEQINKISDVIEISKDNIRKISDKVMYLSEEINNSEIEKQKVGINRKAFENLLMTIQETFEHLDELDDNIDITKIEDDCKELSESIVLIYIYIYCNSICHLKKNVDMRLETMR